MIKMFCYTLRSLVKPTEDDMLRVCHQLTAHQTALASLTQGLEIAAAGPL